MNSLAGGRLFPGIHHHAKFTVVEKDNDYAVSYTSSDGTYLSIHAQATNNWNSESVFCDLASASEFFRKGAVGYSPSTGEKFQGLELKTHQWLVSPLNVSAVSSSFFEDETIFPKGSIQFDNALLMKCIEHEWSGLEDLKVE